jgi:outer membrane protein assembly factor BamB
VDELLLAREAPDGSASLVAVGLDGRERWSRAFRDHTAGGMTYWVAGHFRFCDRLDVAITLARSMMHSDDTFLLDGRTGQIVWHRDVLDVKDPPHTRAFGGGLFSASDLDGDGLDELVLCYPAEVSVTEGATGKVLAVYNVGPIPEAELPGGFWVIGGAPLTADLDGDGRPEILWTTNRDLLMAFKYERGKLRMLWHGETGQATGAMPAVARLPGGEAVIGAAGYPDGFRAINGRDGRVRWSAPLSGSPVSNTLAVDLGEGGGVTFLFAAGNRLLARGGVDGDEVWAVELPGPAQQVLWVDAGNGRAGRIWVSTVQGDVVLLSLDGAKR